MRKGAVAVISILFSTLLFADISPVQIDDQENSQSTCSQERAKACIAKCESQDDKDCIQLCTINAEHECIQAGE